MILGDQITGEQPGMYMIYPLGNDDLRISQRLRMADDSPLYAPGSNPGACLSVGRLITARPPTVAAYPVGRHNVW